ncbi:MAG: hypothetical protein RSC96_09450, partial [Oscillospiraceae bacterium]
QSAPIEPLVSPQNWIGEEFGTLLSVLFSVVTDVLVDFGTLVSTTTELLEHPARSKNADSNHASLFFIIFRLLL